MSLKILIPTPDYAPQRGGVARYLEAIKKTFPNEVRILYRPDLKKRSEFYQLLKIEAVGVDAIWTSHIFPVGTAAMFYYLKTKTPYTIFLHGMDLDLAHRSILRKLAARTILKFAEHVVANSKALADEIEKFCGRKDVLVVYPVVSDELFEEAKSLRLKAKSQKLKVITLLTVSRLVKRKGHIKVLEVIKDLPDVNYQIIGDGPYRQEIINKINELHLEDRVQLITDVEDDRLPEFYSKADIFVMPTSKSKYDREGFGIVYLEAQLFGLPVIATKHPGVDEAVIDKGTGLLIEDHPEALKYAIEKLVKDQEMRHRMGKAGQEFVAKGFKREVQFRKLAEIL